MPNDSFLEGPKMPPGKNTVKTKRRLIGYINIGALGSGLVCSVFANAKQEPPGQKRANNFEAKNDGFIDMEKIITVLATLE